MTPRLVALVGPTASGKSALGMRLARRVGAEIVSADAGQVYRGFDVGTAKPSRSDRDEIPHHGLDLLEPTERSDVARWVEVAHAAIASAQQRERPVVVVGGTGLYVQALLGGLCGAPGPDERLRGALRQLRARDGVERLRRWLRRLDPVAASRTHENDWVRTERALEVVLTTGRPLTAWQEAHRFEEQRYEVRVIVLDPDVGRLDAGIARRTDDMLAGGWIDEVRRLEASVPDDAPAWRTLGYGLLRDHVRGAGALEDVREQIVRATRRFAKRQRTWWRREATGRAAVRLDPEADVEAVLATAAAFLVAKQSAHG